MKKIIIILCALVFVVTTGCSNDGYTSSTSKKSDGIVIYNGLKNPARPQPMEYLDYLENIHGIIVIPTEWDDSVPIQDLDGLLKLDLQSYRAYFKNRHELFLPLNDILASNIYSGDIPDGIMNAVTDDDGNVWGFLISHDIDVMARVYNEDAVEQVGGELPHTPGELKNFLTTAKDAMNIDAIRITPDYCAQAFYDVFAYYNCPLLDSKYTVGWNEGRQIFMDHIYTEEMLQSLQFIKELDNAGLVSHVVGDYNTLSSAFNSGKTITTSLVKGLGYDSRPKNISSGFNDSVFYLEYGSEKISYQDFEYNYIYVVPVNTENAENKVHEFIDTFYGDDQLNKISKWGVEGENFIYKTPDLISIPVFKKYYKPQIADWWIGNHHMWAWTDDELEYYQYWNDTYWPEVKANYYNGTYQVIPIEKSIDDTARTTGKNDIHITFNNLLYKFIVDDMSVKDFLEEYEAKMSELGIANYLEYLNSGVQ